MNFISGIMLSSWRSRRRPRRMVKWCGNRMLSGGKRSIKRFTTSTSVCPLPTRRPEKLRIGEHFLPCRTCADDLKEMSEYIPEGSGHAWWAGSGYIVYEGSGSPRGGGGKSVWLYLTYIHMHMPMSRLLHHPICDTTRLPDERLNTDLEQPYGAGLHLP
jgi:hypothetical protein